MMLGLFEDSFSPLSAGFVLNVDSSEVDMITNCTAQDQQFLYGTLFGAVVKMIVSSAEVRLDEKAYEFSQQNLFAQFLGFREFVFTTYLQLFHFATSKKTK